MESTKTVLISGANGFIGSHLVKDFIEKGWNVSALVRRMPKQKISGVIYHEFDIENPQIINGIHPDVFIHAAFIKAKRGVDVIAQNRIATESLLKSFPSPCFPIFLSSLSANPNALSKYGKQKFTIEKLFSERNGAIIRPGLTLGNGGVFNAMKSVLLSGKPFPLFGKGDQLIQTVFIDDLANGILKVAENKMNGGFVIAENEPVTYREFYTELGSAFGVKTKFMRIRFGSMLFILSILSLFRSTGPAMKDTILGLKQMSKVDSRNDLEKLGLKVRSWKESIASLKK